MSENKKQIQEAANKMKQKGTIGSLREYCGGEVTMECIEKGLKSKDPKIREKAQFAKNVMNKLRGGEIERYEYGGLFSVGDILDRILRKESTRTIMNDIDNLYDKYDNTKQLIKGQLGLEVNDDVDQGNDIEKMLEQLNATFPGLKDAIMNAFKDNYHNFDFSSLKEIKASNGDTYMVLPYNDPNRGRMYFSISKQGDTHTLKRIGINDEDFERGEFKIPQYYSGGDYSRKRYDDGGMISDEQSNTSMANQQEGMSNEQAQQSDGASEEGYDITYEEFVNFVGRYPKYFERLIMDLQSQQGGGQTAQ
ncbi:MAG: hypothetical protein QXF12_06640 [Candidatus Aenigmatarchaeota archaeon]